MGKTKNGKGQYPEECNSLELNRVLVDDKFLLMQQCIKDARELHFMTRHYDRGWWYLSSWKEYERWIGDVATTLFNSRRNPLRTEEYEKILLAGESAKEKLAEIQNQQKILSNLRVQIEEIRLQETREKERLQIERSENFLKATIGELAHEYLQEHGYFDVCGTNGKTYRLSLNGDIYKKRRGIFGEKQKRIGELSVSGKKERNDAIAIIYAHIRRDSDRFERDKRCGSIHIKWNN